MYYYAILNQDAIRLNIQLNLEYSPRCDFLVALVQGFSIHI